MDDRKPCAVGARRNHGRRCQPEPYRECTTRLGRFAQRCHQPLPPAWLGQHRRCIPILQCLRCSGSNPHRICPNLTLTGPCMRESPAGTRTMSMSSFCRVRTSSAPQPPSRHYARSGAKQRFILLAPFDPCGMPLPSAAWVDGLPLFAADAIAVAVEAMGIAAHDLRTRVVRQHGTSYTCNRNPPCRSGRRAGRDVVMLL